MKPKGATFDVDARPALDIKPFIAARAEWAWASTLKRLNETGAVDDVLAQPPPGTWDKAPPAYAKLGLIAFLCCPACHKVSAFHPRIHTISPLGQVTPDFICGQGAPGEKKCAFHRALYFDRYNDKPLYACATERNVRGKWVPEIVYTLAESQTEAYLEMGADPLVRVIAIGPAIGFTSADRDGKVLIA